MFIDNPSVAAATNSHVVSLGKSLSYNGQEVVLGADVDMESVLKRIKSVQLPGDGYVFVLGANDTIFAHANEQLLNKDVAEIIGSRDFINLVKSDRSQPFSTVTLNNEQYFVSITPLDNNGLRTVAIIS